MPKFKDNCFEGLLYYLHSQGKTINEALSEIQKLTGEEPMTLERVKLVFSSIKEGDFSLKGPTLEEKMQTVFYQPSLLKIFVTSCDFETRLFLRETSHLFRQLSSDLPLHLKTLTLEAGEDSYNLTISTENTFKLDYQIRVPTDGKRSEKVDSAVGILPKMLKFNKLTVDTFKLIATKTSSPSVSSYLETMFRNHEKLFSVKNYQVSTPDPDENLVFINSFKPAYLESIKLHCEGTSFMNDLDDCCQSEAWKHASSFTSTAEIWIQDLPKVAHFSFCKLELVACYSLEYLRDLKENLFKNPKLRQFKIEMNEHAAHIDEVREALGIRNSEWAYFNYPGNNQLTLAVQVTDDLVWFKGPCYVEGEE